MSGIAIRPSWTFGRVIGAVAATALVVALAACGEDPDSAAAVGAKTAEPSASAAFPVTIAHKYGSTELTEAPERVVIVGLTEQDAFLALGVVPVATTEWWGAHPGAVWPWATDELSALTAAGQKSPEVLKNTDGLQFEKIAALQPDVIVGLYSGLTQEDYDKLTKIAPTVAQPKDYVDWGIPWDESTVAIGKILGKRAEAQKLVDAIDEKFTAIKAAHPEFADKTALIATPYEGYFVYGEQDARGRLLSSLGFVLPEGLAEATGAEYGGNISKERIDLLDTDALVWLVPDVEKGAKALHDDKLYAALDVAKQSRDVFVSDSGVVGGATSFISVLSLPGLLDGLVPQLTAAVDGDPATPVQPIAD